MDIELYSVLFMAFALGMLHALDADHVIAISGLSCQKADKKTSLLYCARWALGHGFSLLLIGGGVIFLGMAIPERLSAYAENLVGFALIVIGLLVLVDIYRQRAHLHFHSHNGFAQHAHWHTHQQAKQSRQDDRYYLQQHHHQHHQQELHQHNHAPVFVGVLHGVAGSAPLLALLPLSQMASPWAGMGYLLLFGLGVFIAMLVFGGALGQVFDWSRSWSDSFVNVLRISVSLLSIGYGTTLVAGIF